MEVCESKLNVSGYDSKMAQVKLKQFTENIITWSIHT